MTDRSSTFQEAFTNVSASSAGGAPFLIAYGATFLLAALLSTMLPRSTAALIAMFQGGIALPLAFWLERRMAAAPLAADNPLRTLSAQLAMAQALVIPALIVVYSLNPGAVPVVLAGIGGMHFLPYAWLHRTRIYLVLGIVIAIGAFALQLLLGAVAFTYILLYVGVLYWIAAPLLYRHAARLTQAQGTDVRAGDAP